LAYSISFVPYCPLHLLQMQGRISMTDLAEKVGLAASPCTERLWRMERDGVITGYHANL
jgi:Lrp/AsnC family leucine-responsive transcriptional regulator